MWNLIFKNHYPPTNQPSIIFPKDFIFMLMVSFLIKTAIITNKLNFSRNYYLVKVHSIKTHLPFHSLYLIINHLLFLLLVVL